MKGEIIKDTLNIPMDATAGQAHTAPNPPLAAIARPAPNGGPAGFAPNAETPWQAPLLFNVWLTKYVTSFNVGHIYVFHPNVYPNKLILVQTINAFGFFVLEFLFILLFYDRWMVFVFYSTELWFGFINENDTLFDGFLWLGFWLIVLWLVF